MFIFFKSRSNQDLYMDCTNDLKKFWQVNVRNPKKGFTAIELLIVTSLIAVVSTLVGLSFGQLRRSTQHIAQAQNIASVVTEARSNTVAGQNNLQWGVHFTTNDYTLFSGSSYGAGGSDNEAYVLPSGVTISSISLTGGGADVVFNRLSGGTNQPGTITVSSGSLTALLTIQAGGEISVGGTLATPLNTRVVDTRHVHFNLPWSIHTATTLTLTFLDPPNPPSVQNITMAPYFSQGNTVFNWSGSYVIGASTEVLKIHTHLIDAVNNITTLSVHRDKMENTKALNITIDAQSVADYNTSGTVTPSGSITAVTQ